MSDFGPLFGGSKPPSSGRRPERRAVEEPFDGGSLFPDDLSDEVPTYEATTGARTYGVRELNLAIQGALTDSFPREVQVKGEIQGLDRNRHRDHWYFEIVEKSPAGDGIQARLSVVLLAPQRRQVERQLARVPGFRLQDNMQVCLKGRIDMYPPSGKLQLKMTGIDPEATLGQLAINRERILRALASEGLLERNQQRPLPAVPAHVGLVTSVGSAAFNDFIEEIEASGLGLRVTCVDALVQGAGMEEAVVTALWTLARQKPDVIAVVRGGGSRSDLAGFDSEPIARAIAAMPMPVFTGIGHQIDDSVADRVAHRALKTPTACAAEIVTMAHTFLEEVEGCWEAIVEYAEDLLATEQEGLAATSRRVATQARSRVVGEAKLLDREAKRLRNSAPRAIERKTAALLGRTRQVWVAAQGRLADQMGRLTHLRRALERGRLETRQRRHEQRLAALVRRLAPAARRPGRQAEKTLTGIEARVRALDPQRVLARGYSLTYDEAGRLVRDASLLEPGQRLRSHLARGSAWSRVEETRPSEDES